MEQYGDMFECAIAWMMVARQPRALADFLDIVLRDHLTAFCIEETPGDAQEQEVEVMLGKATM